MGMPQETQVTDTCPNRYQNDFANDVANEIGRTVIGTFKSTPLSPSSAVDHWKARFGATGVHSSRFIIWRIDGRKLDLPQILSLSLARMSHKFEKRWEARQNEIRDGSALAYVTKRIAAITPPRALVILRFLLNNPQRTVCFWPNPITLCYLNNYICSAETGEIFGLVRAYPRIRDLKASRVCRA